MPALHGVHYHIGEGLRGRRRGEQEQEMQGDKALQHAVIL
jgi:hypothetical protein